MIVVHGINIMTGFSLTQCGISPRRVSSLWTIPLAPFIHASIYHLMNNIINLFLLSALYMTHSRERYIQSSAIIIVLTGFLVWLFGREASHVGASGWIFGLMGLCIATAVYEKKIKYIMVAVVTSFAFSGMLFGIIPRDSTVSFESHIFGFLSGVATAYLNTQLDKFALKNDNDNSNRLNAED